MVRTRREDGVGALGRKVDRLEVADTHSEALARKVRAQSAGHRRADLDGMDDSTTGKQVPGCLAGSRSDLQDLRLRRQEGEELVEQRLRVRRADSS